MYRGMIHRSADSTAAILCAFWAGIALTDHAARADIIHVPGDYPAIGDAIEAATDGDEIIVAEGEYLEHFNFLGKAVTLRSTDPEDPEVVANTIINGDGAMHVVVCNHGEGPETSLNGFTITGGHAWGAYNPYGGGMVIDSSSPTVMNCVFTGNSATKDGGGMYACESDGPTVTNCIFTQNTARFGGGMRSYQSHPTMIGCTFIENTADEGGGGLSSAVSDLILTGCAFTGNEGAEENSGWGGGGVLSHGSATVMECTFSGNVSNLSGGGMRHSNGDLTVTECMFEQNEASSDGAGLSVRDGSLTIDKCTFHDNASGSDGAGLCGTNCDATVSECVFVDNQVTSRDGGGIHSEHGSLTVTACTFLGNSAVTGAGVYARDDSSLTIAACVFISNQARVSGGGAFIEDVGSAGVSECIFHGNCALGGASRQGGGAIKAREDADLSVTGCLFDGNWTKNYGGAFNITEEGATTIAGCDLRNNRAEDYGGGIYSNDENSTSIVDCAFDHNDARTGGGVYGLEVTLLVRGCSFDENTASDSAGGLYISQCDPASTITQCAFLGNTAVNVGGGMHSGSGKQSVGRCTFEGNTAGEGGGISSSGSATFANCTCVANSADSGAGIYNYGGSPLFVNSVVSGNHASSNGGGAYSYSSDTMYVLCTFTGNEAQFGGALCSDEGETLSNCILWGNAAPDGPQIWGPADATYCDVQGGYEGEGNIDADPLFVDTAGGDYRLSAGSPCIDAGDNTAVPPDALDLDEDGDTNEPIPIDLKGLPRFIDDPDTEDTGQGEPPIVDMGAYEFQAPQCPADFDGDGDGDTADLLILLGQWGTDGSNGGDVDGDGDVDTEDLWLLVHNWGPCP